MLINSTSVEAFAAGLAALVRAGTPRPFAAFRGDFRRPVRMRAKPCRADKRRLAAMNISPSHASSVRKVQRAEHIADRVALAEATT